MRFIDILALMCPAAIFGSQDSLFFAIDYFKERRALFVCVVDCENDSYWIKEFAKSASNRSISVSSVRTSSFRWRQDMKHCVLQKRSIVGVLINTSCRNIADVLITASENMWFNFEHLWLLMDDNNYNERDIYNNLTNHEANNHSETDIYNNLTNHEVNNHYVTDIYNNLTDHEVIGNYGANVVKIMEHLNISVDADIKMAVRTENLQYSIFDIFNFGKIQGGTLKVIDAASWRFASGFSANLNEYKFYKRWDFGQWPMRVVSVATVPQGDFDPSILTSVEPIAGVSPITRISTIIITVIAEVHNIKFIHSITDRWISSFEKNNTKIVANSLYFKKQDLSSCLRVIKNYTYKIGFIHPALTSIETRYYYRIPTTGPGKYENQFLRPLSAGVWRSTIGVAVICIVILVAAARLEQRPSFVQYGLFSVTANICQQFFEDDSETRRSSAARKLTIFITGISCVLIYNYYTSSVVSWLLNGPPPSINSLEELLASPLELIYQDVGYTRSWLSNPGSYYYNKRNMEVEDRIRRKVLKNKNDAILKSLEEGIAMVKAGGYAYHMETANADQLISKSFTKDELCELGSLQSMEKTLLYPAVQKDSPYKEFLTWSLTRLLERGIVSCIQRRTAAHPVSCEGSSPRALALGGAAPAFIMLALGFFISTAILLLERYKGLQQ